MKLWALYPLIGLAIALGLKEVGAIDKEPSFFSPAVTALVFLWPLAVPFLIWHGITVIRWKRKHRHAE